MGAEHRTRTFTALALAFSAFTPTIAFAKTLEGTGNGSAPVDGVVAGPRTGTPPPLVPLTIAPMIVPPPATVARPGIDDEAAPETIADGESEGSDPGTVPRTISRDLSDAESPLGASAAALSAQTPTSPPPGVGQRVAGPPLPGQLVSSMAPAASALRVGPPASSAAAPDAPTTTKQPGSSELDARPEPRTGGSSTVASSAVVVIPDGVGRSNCTSLPRPGGSDALVDWATSRTAEITDGRDLRSHAWIAAAAGGALPSSAGGPFAAYLLEPNSLAVLAVFREPKDGIGGRSDRPSRPLSDLRIGDCDGGPAGGISPGSYVLRYSITGNPDPSASDQTETFLSPPFPVRVVAGPTAPTRSGAGPNVSQS